MSRNWIEFTEPSPIDRGAELYASINPEGRMILGRKTYEALGEPGHIVLLFEEETDVIGVRPAPPRATNAMRLNRNGKSGSRMAFIQRFVRKRDLRLESTVRFPHAHIEDGTLVLDLHTRVPARVNRRRKHDR